MSEPRRHGEHGGNLSPQQGADDGQQDGDLDAHQPYELSRDLLVQAHFHPGALRLQAVRQGRELTVVRLGQTEDSVTRLDSLSYVVGKSGAQGVSYIALFNDRIYRRLEELDWPLV